MSSCFHEEMKETRKLESIINERFIFALSCICEILIVIICISQGKTFWYIKTSISWPWELQGRSSFSKNLILNFPGHFEKLAQLNFLDIKVENWIQLSDFYFMLRQIILKLRIFIRVWSKKFWLGQMATNYQKLAR